MTPLNSLLTNTNLFLQNAHIPWAICGGFALDLFLGKEIRPHSDIDICVFEPDRRKILQYMLQNKWNVYEFRGQGKLRPLDVYTESDPGRNLMCLRGDCELVKFYPCEEEPLLYHQFFHTGIKTFNYLEFLFNTTSDDYLVVNNKAGIKRELSKAILYRDEIPYLAPEIALLYKSSRPGNEEYQYDFEQTFPQMNDEQKSWFVQNLDVLYPNGHKWKTTQ